MKLDRKLYMLDEKLGEELNGERDRERDQSVYEA